MSPQNPAACAIVIPAYNEAASLRGVALRALRSGCSPVIIIDDGSTDETAAQTADLPVLLLRNTENRGKAASLWRGMQAALAGGAQAVITLDADGQHCPEDIPRFLTLAEAHPDNIITGSRLADRAAFPPKRYYANKVANFWISWAAGYPVEDSQCGFRLYPAELLRRLDFQPDKSQSFVFESEILIRAAHLGYVSRPLPIAAIYPENTRPSHFRGVSDIALITRMVARSLLSRCLYPAGLYSGLLRPRFRRWRLKTVGLDGWAMFLLSNLILFASAGMTLLPLCRTVYRTSRDAPCGTQSPGWGIVPGMKLRRGAMRQDYAARLDRALQLLASHPGRRVLVLGGRTSSADQSEAEAGRDYLLARGIVPERIILEDRSLHTLENLRQARELLRQAGAAQALLISNRYHLARAGAIAQGLGMAITLCAAEPRLTLNLRTLSRMLQEAYLLHWYYTGKTWSHWTRNRKLIHRIS
jgi:uncharacterized SAM-binding protein YcdF (DUF218 family)